MLHCQDVVGGEYGFYYFDYSQEEPLLLQARGADDASFFVGLPDGSGVAVAARNGDGRPETYLLRQNKRTDVLWNQVLGIVSRPPLAIPTTTDPNGRYLLWTIMPEFATDTVYALTDLTTCQDEDRCEAMPLGGYPIWSPSSEQLITLTVTNPWWSEGLSNGLMLLREELGAGTVDSPGFGSSVFWLNEEAFGYLARLQNGTQQVVLSDTALSLPQTVISNETLVGALPAELRQASLSMLFVRPQPTNPRIFVIAVADLQNEDAPGYVIWYDQVLGQVTLAEPLPPTIHIDELGIRFSPDGRFLLVALPMPEEGESQLVLQDARGPRFFTYRLQGKTPYPRHFYASWSPDGQWLAIPELGYIRLWHNGSDEQLLTFDELNCTNAAWVDRMEP